VALLSGIALSHELLGRYGRHSNNRDPVSVLRVRTSRSLASLPSPASHTSDPLAPYCYTLPAGTLLRSGWHPTPTSPLLAPSLLSGSPRWGTPLAFFTHYAIYSTVATCDGYGIPWYSTTYLDVPRVCRAPINGYSTRVNVLPRCCVGWGNSLRQQATVVLPSAPSALGCKILFFCFGGPAEGFVSFPGFFPILVLPYVSGEGYCSGFLSS